MPAVPPRNYTPLPSDDEEPVVPPRQDNYLVLEDNSKMAVSRSSALDINAPPQSEPRGSSPITVHPGATKREKPLSRSLPPVSSSDLPPPKPARRLRTGTDLTSAQRHTGVGAVQAASTRGPAAEGNTLSKAPTHRRRPPPKPPVMASSTSEHLISSQTQIVHSSPTPSQGERSSPHGSSFLSPSMSVAQPESSTAEPNGPPKPPRSMPMSASADGIVASTHMCYKGDSLVDPLSRGSPVTHKRDCSPPLPLKPRWQGMTQPSTSSEALFPLVLDRPSLPASSKPALPPKPAPPRPPKSPHARSLSPWLHRPQSAGATLSQDFPSPNSSESPRASPVPPSSSPLHPSSVRARGMSSCTPPPRATERTPPASDQRVLLTRPSIPPKPTLRWQSPPNEQRSAIIRTVETKLKEENILMAEEPYSTTVRGWSLEGCGTGCKDV